MPAVASSLMLALGQLAERRVLTILLKSLAVSLVLFVAVAWGGWYALDGLLDWLGLDDGTFAGATTVREVASLLLALLGLWLAWRIVAMAVIQFFADEVVQAVEARHYPQAAAQTRDLPVSEQFSTSLSSALRALLVNLAVLPIALVLLVTGVGPALLFWLVNAVLVGRELQDMVWLRHRRDAVDRPPVGRGERFLLGGAVSALLALLFWLVNAVLVGRELQDMVWLRHRRDAVDRPPVGRGERFLLGGAVSALLALPLVNLIAPILGAAAATHLIHRKERT